LQLKEEEIYVLPALNSSKYDIEKQIIFGSLTAFLHPRPVVGFLSECYYTGTGCQPIAQLLLTPEVGFCLLTLVHFTTDVIKLSRGTVPNGWR